MTDDLHRGYEFETGMLGRIRTWVDLAPWIRLARVLRILASPTYVGLVFISLGITLAASQILPEYQKVITDDQSSLLPVQLENGHLKLSRSVGFGFAVEQVQRFVARLMFVRTNLAGLVTLVLMALLLLIIWTWVGQVVARAGAMLTAGKPLPSIRESMFLVLERSLKSSLVIAIPCCCVFGLTLILSLIRVTGVAFDSDWISAVLGAIVGLLAIPVGLLAFGALFSIPLGLAAMVNEEQPDPFDSLSRGYEYLLRRPLSVVWYLIVSGVISGAIVLLLSGIADASGVTATAVGSFLGKDKTFIQSSHYVIAMVLQGWQWTLIFALLGGCYLMLRRDAGGQDVEDLWSPSKDSPDTMAKLPPQAFDS